MAVQVTIQRLLRDDDDAVGQSIRQWKIEIEDNFITLRHNHGDGFILLRSADIDMLVGDLQKAKTLTQIK